MDKKMEDQISFTGYKIFKDLTYAIQQDAFMESQII